MGTHAIAGRKGWGQGSSDFLERQHAGKLGVTLTDKEADKLYRGTFGEQLAYKGGDLDANWPIWRKSGGDLPQAAQP